MQNNIRHLLFLENYSKITPNRLELNAVGVARIFGAHVRLLCKMHEIW